MQLYKRNDDSLAGGNGLEMDDLMLQKQLASTEIQLQYAQSLPKREVLTTEFTTRPLGLFRGSLAAWPSRQLPSVQHWAPRTEPRLRAERSAPSPGTAELHKEGGAASASNTDGGVGIKHQLTHG